MLSRTLSQQQMTAWSIMAEQPRKRQRLSPDSYQNIRDDVEGNAIEPRDPTTPKRRASYLSPTKASLARSHPDILAKSPTRASLTEPRGRLLRQELLGIKKSTETLHATRETAPRPPHTSHDKPTASTNGVEASQDVFAEAIAQSFTDKAPTDDNVNHPHQTSRSPLRTREPPNVMSSRHGSDQPSKDRMLDSFPVPKLVTKQNIPARQRSETTNEPDLPPTPVQLGIGTVYERPRGLASSSSIGSRSGSGRHRRRVRNSQTGAVTSSPLKPKAVRSVSPADFSDLEEIDNEVAEEEAPESDLEGEEDQESEEENVASGQGEVSEPGDASSELKEKQAQGAALRFELQQLRNDVMALELMVDQLQDQSNSVTNEDLIQLLTPEVAKNVASLQSPESHPSFVSNASAYLSLFTPSGLSMEHETSTGRKQYRTKVFHKMKMTSTITKLQKSLNLSLELQVDAEDARIDAITILNLKDRWERTNIDHWIGKRLESPLHKFDVGGIVSGASNYFAACITRAKALKYLDKRYNKGLQEISPDLTNQKHNLTDLQAVELSLYIEDTQLLIRPKSEQPASSEATSEERQILLTYDIDLTWTGDAVNRIGLCVTGVNSKAQQSAKELFTKLLATKGVVKAFEGVWTVLGWVTELQPVKGPAGRPRKARKSAVA